MAILVDNKTKVVVQGITGRDGSFHALQMKKYGTKVTSGVTPGKGGQSIDGIPVFDTVEQAVKETKANTSVIYVPPVFATDAIYEAIDAGVKLIVCVTEGIPTTDVLTIYNYLKIKGVRMVGPNCPGVISPGLSKVGIMPGQIHKKGNVGVVSRSGTLTYEVVWHLTLKGLGQSTCIGIGGDPIIGTNFIDCLELFEADLQTEAIVLIGEIGGTDEEEAALYIKKHVSKPVVAFVAGRTAPAGKRMGHAGAIISGGSGTAEEKIRAFNKVGIPVAELPAQVADLVADRLRGRTKRGGKGWRG
jgi:succinyl-CoA synthetase alpha subunit